MSGCLGLLGGDGVPNPIDASSDARARARDAAGDQRREGGASQEGGEAGKPGGAAVMVSSGADLQNWCAVTANGDVECWGDNEVGELGDGTTKWSTTPVKVEGLPGPVAEVAVGFTFACALTKKGGVLCWGNGSNGELGNGKKVRINSTPVPVTGLGSGVIALSTGPVACAVKEDGSAWCWGFTGNTELLGNGQTDALVPTAVTGLTSGVTSVSVGDYAVCAVRRGSVLCWGATDNQGELGNGTTNASPIPVPVTGLPSGITSVSVGSDYACALTAGGAVECWGDGTNGALGNNDEALSPVPVQVMGLTSGVKAISSGYYSPCALKDDGSVVCWGFGAEGELGNGPLSMTGGMLNEVSTVPVPVKGLSGPVSSMSAGAAPCAVTTTGSVECWGITAETALSAVAVTGLGAGATAVTVGGYHSSTAFACAINAMGAVECWGGNAYGQLGNSTTLDSAIPVSNTGILGGSIGVSAAIGGDFACGITSGLALCWGKNDSGQLGNMSTKSSSTPVAVQGLTKVTAIAAGGDFACALTSAGAVSCWGDNTYGQLGNGTTTSSTVPAPVPGLTSGVTAVAASTDYACALLTDGTVDCWGDNTSGELGNGTMVTSLTPGPVSGLTGVTAIATGWYSACAVTSAGGIECWGDNTWGQLGDDTFTPSLVPVHVRGVLSGASRVAAGQAFTCAIIHGGAECWGAGYLGIGTSGSELTPTQVLGLTAGVTDIAVGATSACAVAHGGVQCWGLNTAGQLGNGGAVDDFQATPVLGFP